MAKKQSNNHKPWGSVFLLIIIIGGYLFLNFFSEMKNDKFKINTIEISGNKLISRGEIIDLLKLADMDSISYTQMKTIEEKLTNNEFIKEVLVKVSRPSKLVIKVTEFQPVAMILSGKNYYLGIDGQVYPFRFIEEYGDIPVINKIEIENKQVLEESIRLIKIIKEKPMLYQMISEIFWEGRNPYLILTENAITVEFPQSGWNEKVYLLDRFIQRNFNVIKKKNYKKINMHFNNKIICS